MKRKLFLPLFIAAALLLVFSSCSDKSNIPVPADAAFVFHINGKSLNEKLSWDEVKQNEWFKKMYADADDSLAKKILGNPETSGVDIKSDAYFFVNVRSSGTYVGVTFNIGDEKAFTAFIEKVTKGEKVKKDGSVSMIVNNSSVASWNSSRFVAIMDAPDANPYDMEKSKGYSEDSLVFFAKEVYNLKGKKSIGSNAKFSSMLKEAGDAHLWVNSGALYGNSMPPFFSMTKIPAMLEGNYSAATINFENGKIAVDAKQYMNKEMTAIYKKNPMKNIDPALLKKIPAGDVAAAMAFNCPPVILKEMVGLTGLDGLLNIFLGQVSLSMDDIVKSVSGDLVFSVSDFKVSRQKQTLGSGPDAFTYEDEVPSAKLLFGVAIGEQSSFDKVVAAMSKQLGEMGDMPADLKSKIAQQTKDGWFLAGNDSAYLSSFGAAATDHSFISKISGHPMGGYIDIQKFISGSRPVMDSASVRVADEALKVWQDIVFYGGEISGDAAVSRFEINFVDKNSNSLKQLNKFLDFVAGQVMRERKEVVIQEIVPAPPPAAGK